MGMFGHCSQELVNLCLLGRCVSNVFDGEESMGGGMMLRGVRLGGRYGVDFSRGLIIGSC